MSVQGAALALAWIVILLLGLSVGGLLNRLRILEAGVRREGLRGPLIGSHIPLLVDESRSPLAPPFSILLAERSCPSCVKLVPEIGSWLNDHPGARVVLVGGEEFPEAWTEAPFFAHIRDTALTQAFAAPATPWLIGVDNTGIVRQSAPVPSFDVAIESLLDHVEDSQARREAASEGGGNDGASPAR